MANRKKGGGTVEAVWDLCEPIVKGFGLELWDVRYLKEGAQWYLRVYIDRQEGVTIEEIREDWAARAAQGYEDGQ